MNSKSKTIKVKILIELQEMLQKYEGESGYEICDALMTAAMGTAFTSVPSSIEAIQLMLCILTKGCSIQIEYLKEKENT